MYIIMCCGWAAGPRFGVCVRRPRGLSLQPWGCYLRGGRYQAQYGQVDQRASDRAAQSAPVRPSLFNRLSVSSPASHWSTTTTTTKPPRRTKPGVPSRPSSTPSSPAACTRSPSLRPSSSTTPGPAPTRTSAPSTTSTSESLYSQIFGHFHSHSLKICVFTYLHRN
jgi:hypothetical protein